MYLPRFNKLFLQNIPFSLADSRHINVLSILLFFYSCFLTRIVLLVVLSHELLQLYLVMLLSFVHLLSLAVGLFEGFQVFSE